MRSADVTLTAADGTSVAAFSALPDAAARAGVVVLPDVRGLYRFYEELALRFAERGMAAVAIDYFGRTAGASRRGDDFPYGEHMAQTTPEHVRQDVRAAVEFLRSPAGGGVAAVFTVGFCFGGRNAWLAAAGGHGLAGAVGFYGSLGERNGTPGPVQRAAEIEAPILALQAGADENILPEQPGARGWDPRSRPPAAPSPGIHPFAPRLVEPPFSARPRLALRRRAEQRSAAAVEPTLNAAATPPPAPGSGGNSTAARTSCRGC